MSSLWVGIDRSALLTLWNDCRDRAPDCTVEEVSYFVKQKLPITRSGKIHNPTGFLLRAIPKCFEGQTFQCFRREQSRLKEEQRRRKHEEMLKQTEWDAEAEQYRREEEARLKAEQLLLKLSEEESKSLYEQAKTELSAKGYKAAGAILDKLLQERVIRNLAKRIMSDAWHPFIKPLLSGQTHRCSTSILNRS